MKSKWLKILEEIKNNFGDERRTLINDTRRGITNEDLIPEETRVLTVSSRWKLKKIIYGLLQKG